MLSEEEQIADTAAFRNFLKDNLRAILIFAVLGGLLGYGVTFLLKKEYQSVGNVFPPSAPSIEFSIENPNFGYDVEADRLIQILHSNEVRDSVSRKFDLVSYFELKKDDPEWRDRLTRLYRKHISFERTPSMSILIKAQTTDPVLSSDIVNYIITIADQIRERIYKQNIRIAYDNAMADFEVRRIKNDSAQHTLVNSLQKNKLNSLMMLASNAQISIDVDKLSEFQATSENQSLGGEIIAYKNIRDRYNESEGRLVRIQKAFTNPIPKLYVIDKGEPRYKKVYPSRLMHAVLGMALAMIVLTILLLSKKLFVARQ